MTRSWGLVVLKLIAKEHKKNIVKALRDFIRDNKDEIEDRNMDTEEWVQTTAEEEAMLTALEEEIL